MEKTFRIGFLGTGSIAQAHAYALDAVHYYYEGMPKIERVVAASPTPAHREAFANRYGFAESCAPEAVWERDDLDAVYILGANPAHAPQLIKAIKSSTIKRIYVEKPVASSRKELAQLEEISKTDHGKFVMMGFQFLQKSPVRQALAHWQTGKFGDPVHFRTEYLHSSYLSADYRAKRGSRLLPIPVNGATVDLGSHILSLLTAFLGDTLTVQSAFTTNANLTGFPEKSDLCTTAMLQEAKTGAIGTMTASRISAGTGDQLKVEIYGTLGSIVFDTAQPDIYMSYLPEEGWQRHDVYGNYAPASKFYAGYSPAGWLRAMVHNHYLFLGGEPDISFVPTLEHGIQVQRLVQQIADALD
ncbi:MAG: Gfo/Idh/MocA family oxidoreductase [Anaerolineaceae bacterium]|nr:Gfo/Idh/MocA family oxidoreductase [Anaerolineaceae bacterium]